MTLELIFGVVQAIVTSLLGSLSKKGKIQKRFIPIQNMIVGVVAGFLAVHFKLYDDVIIAMFVCLAVSLGVGGAYDATQVKKKGEQYDSNRSKKKNY